MGASFDAHKKLHAYASYRVLTNFPAFYEQAAVERTAEAVYGRKLFFQARQLANQGARGRALEGYEHAFAVWIDLLLGNKAFRDVVDVQAETYEAEIRYLKLLQLVKKGQIKPEPKMGFRPIFAGLSQMGLVRPGFSPVVNLPVLDLDEDQEKLITPVRTVHGPLEIIYVCDLKEPERTQLQEILLALSQGPVRPPLALTAYQRNWMLVAAAPWLAGPPPPPWQPLLSEQALGPVRERAGITRPRQPVPPPPGAPPGP